MIIDLPYDGFVLASEIAAIIVDGDRSDYWHVEITTIGGDRQSLTLAAKEARELVAAARAKVGRAVADREQLLQEHRQLLASVSRETEAGGSLG